MRFVATCARGTEPALERELEALGVLSPQAVHGAVSFEGELAAGYGALLRLRVASRLLMPLAELDAPDPEALYEGVRTIPWLDHLDEKSTLAVHCVAGSREQVHTRYLALKTKDAIVDAIRDRRGARPDIDTVDPDLRVHLHYAGGRAAIAIDIGGPLHMRGYRPSGAPAPLRETLAAAIVDFADAPARAIAGAPIVDPLCGSGTLLVEAGLAALDVAPGLLRRGAEPVGWLGHDEAVYARVLAECEERRAAAADRPLVLVGYDRSAQALQLAEISLARAGLSAHARLERRDLADATPPDGPPGVVVTNPPYGDRLGEAPELFVLYETLGDVLRRRFLGYRAAILAPEGRLPKNLGLRPEGRHELRNGPIACALIMLQIRSEPVAESGGPAWRRPSTDAPMFDNRLRKNAKRVDKLAKRAGLEAYRIYDADIPEYNLAVDRYADHVVVQEYAPPRSVDPARAEAHLRDALLVVPDALGVPEKHVHLKVRRRQRSGAQYEASSEDEVRLVVGEAGHRFEVELSRHLDTGLFLDHRLLRARAAADARGARFLNLYAYTCAASVYAAAAGARLVTSVDLSPRYLEWGERNFVLNGLDPAAHRFIRAECGTFLERDRGTYDIIYLNPPSYSRSRTTGVELEIKRDHGFLIDAAMSRLSRDGVLYFSTHARGFELDEGLARAFDVEEISDRTVPPDFVRSPHKAYELRRL